MPKDKAGVPQDNRDAAGHDEERSAYEEWERQLALKWEMQCREWAQELARERELDLERQGILLGQPQRTMAHDYEARRRRFLEENNYSPTNSETGQETQVGASVAPSRRR